MAYGYSLRGYEGFCVDFQQLIDGIHIVKYDRWETHVIISMTVTTDKGNPVWNLDSGVVRKISGLIEGRWKDELPINIK